jgi:hypothetical protein
MVLDERQMPDPPSIKVTRQKVWGLLADRVRPESLSERLPSEVAEEVEEFARELCCAFAGVERACLAALTALPYDAGPDQVEASVSASPWSPLLRMMLDGEDYAPLVWQLVRPHDE